DRPPPDGGSRARGPRGHRRWSRASRGHLRDPHDRPGHPARGAAVRPSRAGGPLRGAHRRREGPLVGACISAGLGFAGAASGVAIALVGIAVANIGAIALGGVALYGLSALSNALLKTKALSPSTVGTAGGSFSGFSPPPQPADVQQTVSQPVPPR